MDTLHLVSDQRPRAYNLFLLDTGRIVICRPSLVACDNRIATQHQGDALIFRKWVLKALLPTRPEA